jgi:virginiamycin B lyase
MRVTLSTWSLLAAGVGVFLVHAAPAVAQDVTLSGIVSSAQDGPMEGVLVTAKKDGSTIATTVVSDDKGHYSFPAGRLDPGHYALNIRAIDYLLDSPKAVDVAAGSATADIKLAPTKNISGQLTNSEWLMSLPGTDAQKKAMYACVSCHTYERILKSTHSADEFMHDVFPRMANYSSQAFPLLPQRRIVSREISRAFSPQVQQLADYLAANNLSAQDTWSFPLKTLPRPKGRATHVIITEYDLPHQTIQPHDVALDSQGTVWFSDFGENEIGKMDPQTGKVTEYPYPASRQGPYANGNLDLEFDKQGNIWIGMMTQAGIAKFDPKTEKFQLFPLPKNYLNDSTQQAMVVPTADNVDGKVWFNDVETIQVGRVNINTGAFDPWIKPYANYPNGPHSLYGIYADSQNNAFFCDFSGESIGRIDAKTAEVTLYPTPTKGSRPRRGRMDDRDRLWFTETYGDSLGMFDTKDKSFKEWKIAVPYAGPYDVAVDRWGDAWTGGMYEDRVTRINTESGEETDYLVPRETNMRRAYVDSRGSKPVFWVGNHHQAAIVKVEPLD